MITNGTVQYSTEPSASGNFTGGTVATYSCAYGYELVGEENRTCLVDGTEPHCIGHCCACVLTHTSVELASGQATIPQLVRWPCFQASRCGPQQPGSGSHTHNYARQAHKIAYYARIMLGALTQ